MKRRTLTIVVLLILILAVPLSVAAQTTTTEPYSGGGVTETTIAPRIEVLSAGLTKTFTATGLGTDCAWNFGDDSTGTGNPVDHTYAAAGTYDVSANCGGAVLSLQVTAAQALSTTGMDVARYVLIAIALITFGGLLVRATRPARVYA